MKPNISLKCTGQVESCPLVYARVAHAAGASVPGVVDVEGVRSRLQPVDIDACACMLHIGAQFHVEEGHNEDLRSVAESIGRAMSDAMLNDMDLRPTSFYLATPDLEWSAYHDRFGRYVEWVDVEWP